MLKVDFQPYIFIDLVTMINRSLASRVFASALRVAVLTGKHPLK